MCVGVNVRIATNDTATRSMGSQANGCGISTAITAEQCSDAAQTRAP
jgi:hypothetical protein